MKGLLSRKQFQVNHTFFDLLGSEYVCDFGFGWINHSLLRSCEGTSWFEITVLTRKAKDGGFPYKEVLRLIFYKY